MNYAIVLHKNMIILFFFLHQNKIINTNELHQNKFLSKFMFILVYLLKSVIGKLKSIIQLKFFLFFLTYIKKKLYLCSGF